MSIFLCSISVSVRVLSNTVIVPLQLGCIWTMSLSAFLRWLVFIELLVALVIVDCRVL